MKPFILFIAIAFIFGCKDANKASYSKKKIVSEAQEHAGKKLMEINCYVCHNPTATEGSRIGPPMIAIKKHYIDNKTTKEEFTKLIQDWVKNPTKEKAKMIGAVKRFGVMPKQVFPEETIKQIAEYMFEFEIAKPAWFEEHYNNEKGIDKNNSKKTEKESINIEKQTSTNSEEVSFADRGLQYALSTKAVLGKNLMEKIQKEGTLAALEFCNIKAYPLTDSMAVSHNASIKRVSDKPRNANNKANVKELEYIKIFKQDAILNKESLPIVVENSTKVNVYYPIKTNGMCLQCHGKPNSDIKLNTLAQIKNLYPKDLATGYSENQVRGIWSVTFNK